MPNITTIYEWNNLDQPLQQLEWKSKTFITAKPVNLGAARVVADYPTAGNVATNWEAATGCWGVDPYVPPWEGLVPTPTVFPYPVISTPDLGLSIQDGTNYGVESDGTHIYKTVISQPSAYPTWDGASINFTKTTYDLQGTVINTTSGSWTGAYVGPGALSGMFQNTTDYWWLTLFSSGIVYVFYQSTLLFAATDTGSNNPFNSFVGTIKVQDKFYWWANNTSASYRYDKPSVYGSVAPTVKNVSTAYRMLSYDPVLGCLWGSTGNGVTMYKLDFNLNILATHPLQSVFGFVANGGFIAFNGILAVVGGTGNSPFSVVNNRFVIANFNVADNTQPTIIRQDSVTSESPNVGVLPPPSAVGLLQNGYAYYRSELIDLAAKLPPAPAPATTLSWNALSGLTFKLWVNKQLVMTRTVVNSRVFRMPTGYKSDTFEVSVEGDVRVRAIHLAETPTALENV